MAGVDGGIQFALNAEAGVLERQAILACESLRRFGGELADARLTVVSPRAARRPSGETVRRLEELHVEYLPLDLESACPESGPSYKLLATAHLEARPGPPVLVQLDSDTLFLGEPKALLIDEGAAARPVDDKGICTTGPKDVYDAFWRAACEFLGVDYDRMRRIWTTVTGLRIKANYNGGLVAARRDLGLFQRTTEFTRRLIDAGIIPPSREGLSLKTGVERVEGLGARYFGINQMNFSLACEFSQVEVSTLPATYNLPIHMLDLITERIPSSLVHIHYHWLASLPDDDENAMLSPRLRLSEEQADWIRSKLPIQS